MIFDDDWTTIHHGDCLDVMADMDADSIDAIVTDPPYALTANKKGGSGVASVNLDSPYGRARIGTGNGGGFMGQAWDSAIPPVELWREALRVAKPGAHLVAFGATRTHHRLMCAIEDAGWEIRDCLGWLYSTGFPKSLNLDRDSSFCSCESNGCTLPYDHEQTAAESPTEHDLRPLWQADVPSPINTGDQRGEVLLSGVQEHGAPTQGRQQLPDTEVRGGQSSMEGRRDVSEASRQLRDGEVRPSTGMGQADGEAGRLRDGASVSDGTDARTTPDANGMRPSPRPRPAQQPADEPGAVADESGAQARGVWPTCGGCGKPRIPRGLGTALKPAWEPIILARKPLSGTVAANVQRWGTGALNIDGCRVGTDGVTVNTYDGRGPFGDSQVGREYESRIVTGRWPANIVHDGSDEVLAVFPQTGVSSGGKGDKSGLVDGDVYGSYSGENKGQNAGGLGDSGSAARFFKACPFTKEDFAWHDQSPTPSTAKAASVQVSGTRFLYCPKADKRERDEGLYEFEEQFQANAEFRPNHMEKALAGDSGKPHGRYTKRKNFHPTVKPLDLMRWLVRLVTPPDGVVLDPFMGSGTTLKAARAEGHRSIGIDLEREHCEIAWGRLSQGVLL